MKAFASLMLASCLLLAAACSDERDTGEPLAEALDDTAVEHAVKHADASYVCPMHPQIVRDEPGNCPICGMKLVKKTAPSGSAEPRKPLYYRNPMNPAITSDKPMKDEMGMDYVPIYADQQADAEGVIGITPGIVQNMGVRTEQARRETLWKYIKAVGYVGYNEDRLFHVHVRATGWVENIYIHAQGERVRKGQPLLEYYSPEIVNAQEDFLLATRGGLLPAARERLRLLNVPGTVIEEVSRTRKSRKVMPILSPTDGVVAALGVRHGMYITPEMELFSIADLSEVWVKVSVFDHQLNWVQPGRPAEIRVSALPGKIFEGEVDYVYPELDPLTRTLQVRLKFANPDGFLQPNMFADVAIYGGPRRDALTVPREAVIFSGLQERVIKSLGGGRFQPAAVTIGMQTPERIEILEGLQEGDAIVTSAQFLIDSEAGLRGVFKRMQTPAPDQESTQTPEQGVNHAH